MNPSLVVHQPWIPLSLSVTSVSLPRNEDKEICFLRLLPERNQTKWPGLAQRRHLINTSQLAEWGLQQEGRRWAEAVSRGWPDAWEQGQGTVSILYCARLCMKCSRGITNFLKETL